MVGKLHNVTLFDDRSHEEVFPDKEHLVNYGHFVLAESEGENILLWTSPYIIAKGQYIVDEAAILQTTLIHGRYTPEEKKQMHDNPFISRGWDFPDYYKRQDLKIVEEAGRITWSLGGREFIGQPPVWQLKGSHAGVTCDLTMKALCPAFLYWGSHQELKTAGQAVYEQFCSAEGTIAIAKKVFPIQGYACHEHAVVGPTHNQVETMSGPGHEWHHGFTPQLKYHIFVAPRAATTPAYGWAIVEDKVIPYDDPKDISSEEVAYWLDPRTRHKVPCKWHLTMRTGSGILDVTLTAYARACYFWIRQSGYILMYWFLISGNGAFIFPDGRTVRARDMQCGLQLCRTFLATR